MTPSVAPLAPAPALQGRALRLAQAVWLAVLALELALYALGRQPQFNLLQTPCVEPACANLQLARDLALQFQALGGSMRAYAAYILAVDALSTLAFILVAAVIFWRRSDDPLALYASFVLITFGLGGGLDILRAAYPGLTWLVSLLLALGNSNIILFLFLFPQGRFVPAWTGWLALAAVAREVLAVYAPLPLWEALFVVSVGLAMALLVYRYRRVLSSVQRQQTKWVIYGVLSGVCAYVALLSLYGLLVAAGHRPQVVADLILETAVSLSIALIPLSIGMAILRSHLWDIDVLIRRTLIYSILTALLALAYFGAVIVLQNITRALTGQGQSELVTVPSTLAIAALFVPLRRRVQAFIDRRFYRRKYDAGRTLVAFSATLRDEVELDRLTEHLLGVVDSTLQPAHISFWLKSLSKKEVSKAQDLNDALAKHRPALFDAGTKMAPK